MVFKLRHSTDELEQVASEFAIAFQSLTILSPPILLSNVRHVVLQRLCGRNLVYLRLIPFLQACAILQENHSLSAEERSRQILIPLGRLLTDSLPSYLAVPCSCVGLVSCSQLSNGVRDLWTLCFCQEILPAVIPWGYKRQSVTLQSCEGWRMRCFICALTVYLLNVWPGVSNFVLCEGDVLEESFVPCGAGLSGRRKHLCWCYATTVDGPGTAEGMLLPLLYVRHLGEPWLHILYKKHCLSWWHAFRFGRIFFGQTRRPLHVQSDRQINAPLFSNLWLLHQLPLGCYVIRNGLTLHFLGFGLKFLPSLRVAQGRTVGSVCGCVALQLVNFANRVLSKLLPATSHGEPSPQNRRVLLPMSWFQKSRALTSNRFICN